jgi:hypothetical protein
MKTVTQRNRTAAIAAIAMSLLLVAGGAGAEILGIQYDGSTPIDLRVKADNIQVPDGSAPYVWGYTTGPRAQYPGPTLIVNQGDTVTITLVNDLDNGQAVSMVFPGQSGVVASGGSAGLVTQEAPADSSTMVTYTFTASNAGTFMYHSGTRPDLQIEMGLLGAIIVRPPIGDKFAYDHADTEFDDEFLYLHTEMDSTIHNAVEFHGVAYLDGTDWLQNYRPVFWFYNGRAAPDTVFGPNVSWLPVQPYNILPLMRPGDRTLVRMIGGGRESHPFHPHGQHLKMIGRDGRMLSSGPGNGADLAQEIFTIDVVPGSTSEGIFQWTGDPFGGGMGWDIYGTPALGPDFEHECIDGDGDGHDDTSWEYCADHYKAIPVDLPEALDLTFGGLWGGSPYMGHCDVLPVGEGGLNPWCGFSFPWHSHAEKELANDDVFPGGAISFAVVLPPLVQ